MAKGFAEENVILGLVESAVLAVEDAGIAKNPEAARAYIKSNFGIDTEKIENDIDDGKRVDVSGIEAAIKKIYQDARIQPHLSAAIKEQGSIYSKATVSEMLRVVSGSARRVAASPTKLSDDEVKGLRDEFIKTLSKMGYRKSSTAIDRFIKGQAKKGTLRGQLTLEESKVKGGEPYKVVVGDLVMQFIASEARKSVITRTVNKRENPTKYAEETEKIKEIQSALGKLGFPTKKEKGGGRVTGTARYIQEISLKDPQTASFLMGLLFYDDKGRPRKDIASFTGDWSAVVRAIRDTPRGTPLERLQSAIEAGEIDKGILRVLNRNLSGATNQIVVKPGKDGGFDLSSLLETYGSSTSLFERLFSTITGIRVSEIKKIAKETQGDLQQKDDAKAARQLKRVLAQKDRDAKAAKVAKAQELAAAEVATAQKLRKELKVGKTTLKDHLEKNLLKRLDGIISKLKQTDPGSGKNTYQGEKREKLVAEAIEVQGQIDRITGVFKGLGSIDGLTQRQKKELKENGLSVGLSKTLSKRIDSKVSLATNRETGSTELSTRAVTEIEKMAADILKDGKVGDEVFKTLVAKLLEPGKIYQVEQKDLGTILTGADLSAAREREVVAKLKAAFGSTRGLLAAAKKRLKDSIRGSLTDAGAKGVSPAHDAFVKIVQQYIAHAQKVFANADPRTRGAMVIEFAASMYQFQQAEKLLIAKFMGFESSSMRPGTYERHSRILLIAPKMMDSDTGKVSKSTTKAMVLTGRISGIPDGASGSQGYYEYLYLSQVLSGEISGVNIQNRSDFFRSVIGATSIAEDLEQSRKIAAEAAAAIEASKTQKVEEKNSRQKEALESIRKILAGDRAAFSDPKEMLKLVSYISSTRGGKLTATNFIQSLLQKISDKDKVGATPEQLASLAKLMKVLPDGTISGPKTGEIFKAGDRGLLDIADKLLKGISPEKGSVTEPGKELAASITGAFNSGAAIFKGVAGKKLEKTLTDAAKVTEKSLADAEVRRERNAARESAGPRVRSTRAKLGELTKNEAGEFVDAKGLPLGFAGKGFKYQGQVPASVKYDEKGNVAEGGLGGYLVKQGLIAKPADLVMKPGEGRGSKPIIDLDKTTFVSEAAKAIAGIVQDVRAKAMKIDPATGAKVSNQVADSLTSLLKGPSKGGVGSSSPIGKALGAAIDEAMADPAVKRTFTRGGVKMEQTAPEFVKEREAIAAEKGQKLTPQALRKRFLKDFKGTAATAVAARLGVDVAPGVDPGKAIAESLAAGKAAKQQAAEEKNQAKEVARRIKALRRQVRVRQSALADQTKVGGQLAEGQPGVSTTAAIRAKLAEQRVRSMPLHERRAAYAQMGLSGAPARAAGGAPQGQTFTGQGMQFVPGATIAIPQVDIGPLRELASQMAEVGKSLALIPKATIPKGMSASLKEIASLMQVLATVKSPPKGANVSAFKKLIQDLNALSSAFGGKAPNTKNVGNIIAALRSVNKILDALSGIGTKMPAKTLLSNMQEFKKSLQFIPKMFSSLGSMDFAGISNIGATIASTKFPSQQRLAGINEALLMIKQILETANSMKGGRMPTITGGAAGGGRFLVSSPTARRIGARQAALAASIQGPGFGHHGQGDRFGSGRAAAARAIPLRQRLVYYEQARAEREAAAASRGQRAPRERSAQTGGGGNRFGGGRQTAPAGQFGVPRQIGGPMGPQISTGGVQQFSNDAMGILGNLAQQIRFGFTQEITREIAQSFGRILAHLKDGIVKFNSTLETATVAFQTLFENEQKAQGMEVNFKRAKDEAEGLVNQLKIFANVTPFRFPQLAESARRMRAFGFETKEILPNMQAIGDAVAALGGEDDKIFRITYALGQMRQAGRVYQNDMMQLANAGIAGYDILSKALLQDFVKLGQLSLSHNGKVIDQTTIQTEDGYKALVAAVNAATEDATRGQVTIAKSTSSEIANIFTRVSKDPIEAIRDLTQSGQIAGGAASSAIIEGLGQNYGGGMRKLSKTFEGAFSTLADVTQAFVADITRPIFNSIRDEMIDLGTFLQSMFVSNLVKNVAKGFEKIVGPVQEVIGSIYQAISAVITGIIQLFGEFSGAFSLMDNKVVRVVNGVSEVRTTFEKTTGAGQEFIAKIGSGLKVVADLLQFPLAKGLAAAAVGLKLISVAWNMNPILLTLTAITISLSTLKDFLSSDAGSGFARGISGMAASLTDLARSFKQKIMPLLADIMQGIGSQFFVSLLATFGLMIPILQKLLALVNTLLELINALPFVPDVLGLVAGFLLMRKMLAPLGQMMLGKSATVDARGNPIAATKGLIGTLESGINTITAKLLPYSKLVDPAGKIVAQRGVPQVPVGTLGKPGAPTGFGAVAGNIQKVVIPASEKKMLSSQMLKQLLASGAIRFDEYKLAMEARRAAMEAAANSGTGPGGISGLRKLAQTGGGRSAALKALGGGFTESSLGAIYKIEQGLGGAINRLLLVLRNLKAFAFAGGKIKASSDAIKSLIKALSVGARAIPKSAVSAISKLMKSFVLASALKVNSTIFSIVPKVFVPFMEQIKATGPRGTGGDIVGSVRRAAAAGMNRAGRLSLAGAQVPFAMPRQGVTGGPIGYLVRAIRGLRPNRLPFEAPGRTTAAAAQRTGVINRTIQAVLQRIPTQVPVGTLGAPGRPSGFGAIIGRLERVLLNVTQGSVAQTPGRIRPQVLGGSPSMYGVSIFKVIQERIKYLASKLGDTAGLYTARITTALEKSFLAFDKMMRRLAGAPARIFTMQNLDRIITRYAEGMVRAFTPKTAPIAGFLAGGTKKAPTELFAGLKDAIARRVVPNTLVGGPGSTFTDKIFAGADKLFRVSERFAEAMVKASAPRTVPIEKFLAGGTVRAPRELFAGLKDAIARIVIPDKFTQPISLFQRAVMFFRSATTNFGSFVRAIGRAGSSAAGSIAGGVARGAAGVAAGGAAALLALKQSRAMQNVTSQLKSVSGGIKSVISKFGVFAFALQGIMTVMTAQERMKSEKNNEGAIIAQEGAGLAGSVGGFFAAKGLGKMIGGTIGTFLGGGFGTILGSIVGGAVLSAIAGFVFPNQEITPADQDREAKSLAINEYMADAVMDATEFTQLLTDFDFTPIELLDRNVDYYKSVQAVFDLIQNGASTIVPSLGDSLDYMLKGLGSQATEKKGGKDGVSFSEYANSLTEQVRAKMAKYYENLGNSPMEAMILAQAEIAKAIAAMGQVTTLSDAQSLLSQLATSWEVNPEAIKGFGLFIGGATAGLEKLQTRLEKVRSEFQKLAGRLQSRVNAVFEQQMAKALEKAKDAFLATQIVMVDGAETNILALREEIEATEKRNRLLAIEKKLRDAARSVEMAKLGQYDASMDPLEAAARMREAQEAQTEAIKDAALERKKIALEEAMVSDPVVEGLENIDERFEAARMKFQEGMEDILDLVEAGKLTGSQAAAKIKALYTTTLGEVGVLDANLDLDARNFGDAFLGTWDSILKKFTAIVTKLKRAISAVNNFDPNAGSSDNTDPSTPTNGTGVSPHPMNDKYDRLNPVPAPPSTLGAAAIQKAAAKRFTTFLNVLQFEVDNANIRYTNPFDASNYSTGLGSSLKEFGPGGTMSAALSKIRSSKDPMKLMDGARDGLRKFFNVKLTDGSGKLRFPLAGMASGGEVMGVGGMFQVGETGRETLQVVPGGVARIFPRRIRPINQIGMAGGSGGGVNASVIINNPTVRNDQDIRKLADAVGKAQSSLLRSAGIGRI